jgi:hypothetical protein
MTTGEFLTFLNPVELTRILRLNKASAHLMRAFVNFSVLFETQGILLTAAEVEATKISASMALQVAAK